MQSPFLTYVVQPKNVCNTVHHCIVGPKKSGVTTFAHQLTLDIVKQLEGDLMFLYTPEHEEDNVLQEEQQSLWTNILSIEKQFQNKRVEQILDWTNLCEDTAEICADYTGITFQSDKKKTEIFFSGPQVLRYIQNMQWSEMRRNFDFGVDPDQFSMQNWAPFKPVIVVQEGQNISDCWNKEQIDYLYHTSTDFSLKMMCELLRKKGAKKYQIDFDKINPLEKPVFS